MSNRVLTVAAAFAVLFGVTTSAQAQDPAPTVEVGVGYQLLRTGEFFDEDVFDEDEDECDAIFFCEPARTFPFGVNVDVVRNFGPLGVVGEIGWAFDKEDDSFDGAFLDGDAKYDVWHAAGGVRYTGGATVRPFAQVLLGVAGNRLKLEGSGEEIDASQTNLMVQPGAGVAFTAGGVGVFGQVDYRRVFGLRPTALEVSIDETPGEVDESELDSFEFDRNDFRFVVGVRFSM